MLALRLLPLVAAPDPPVRRVSRCVLSLSLPFGCGFWPSFYLFTLLIRFSNNIEKVSCIIIDAKVSAFSWLLSSSDLKCYQFYVLI